jgi:Rps23 Pro-64 3,4-dihydroxylase Tpa1-like proline 4-hydroxylase
MNDNNDINIRSDTLIWVNENNKIDNDDDHLLNAIRILRSIPYELNMTYGVPMFCQLACFENNAKYVPHRDAPQTLSKSLSLSNLLLYLLSLLNTREYTLVLYLNDKVLDKEFGGKLRLYVEADKDDVNGTSSDNIIDIEPLGGRLVMFNSRHLLHEVQESKHRRIALTLWIGSKPTLSSSLRRFIINNL